MKDSFMIVLFFVIGISFLVSAISAKRGRLKGMFMLTINPITPVSIIYAAIPLGIGAISIAVGGMIDNVQFTRLFIGIGLGGGIIIGYVFMFWKPSWLKPNWLLWLEESYDQQTIDFMFDQARKEGRAWGQRVATQAGLEAWAKEMEQKYRSYMGDGYG